MTQVEAFGYYMYNKWNSYEATVVFGENLGSHIFDKWINNRDVMMFFMNLDNECRKKLVERAEQFYC
jgi:hypothetical protein